MDTSAQAFSLEFDHSRTPAKSHPKPSDTKPINSAEDRRSCPNCGGLFSTGRTSDRKRHWRPPVHCPKTGCAKTFRTDKIKPFLKHVDKCHNEMGKEYCREYFEKHKEILKSIFIPFSCARKIQGNPMDNSINVRSGNQQYQSYSPIEEGSRKNWDNTKETCPTNLPPIVGVNCRLGNYSPSLKGGSSPNRDFSPWKYHGSARKSCHEFFLFSQR